MGHPLFSKLQEVDAAEAQLAERKKEVEVAKQKLKELEASEKAALNLVKKARPACWHMVVWILVNLVVPLKIRKEEYYEG